jgi:sugar lactone lactonase YvrE
VRKVDVVTGLIWTVVSGLNSPQGMAADGAGNVYVADTNNQRILRVDGVTQAVTVFAGTGTYGYNGDGILATAAQLGSPSGVTVDGAGNVYIADTGSNRVRKVAAGTGIITTVAGNGTNGYNLDGIPATSAWLSNPAGVAVDGAGNVYVADTNNHRVRKVEAGTGLITTVAGTWSSGYNGDGMAGTSAWLYHPVGLLAEASGDVLIADTDNYRIRKLDAGTGIITTVAGTGSYGYNGDNIPATSAQMRIPTGLALDGDGNLYIADRNNQSIREVMREVVAGPPQQGYLAVRMNVTPTPAVAGQVVTVRMTVRSTGAGDVTGVVPGVVVTAGAGLAVLKGGPVPAGSCPVRRCRFATDVIQAAAS